METEITIPQTLQDAIKYFADADRCLSFLVAMRWPNGEVVCPHCGVIGPTFIASRRIWACKHCRKQFSIKVGTAMEDSPIGLDKWLTAMWMVTNCKNGVSSYEIHRAIGVTQKTAWFLLHRIRLAFCDQPIKLSGRVEADETYIGGLEKNKHKDKKTPGGQGKAGKVIVAGLLERGGKARATVVDSNGARHVGRNVRKHVQPGTNLLTDAHHAYTALKDDYVHMVVDHAVEYVRDHVHTNGLENFWALLKRMIKGTYVSIAPEHVDAYVSEEVFRYNERRDNDAGRFCKVAKELRGKRLTYKQLTAGMQTSSLFD